MTDRPDSGSTAAETEPRPTTYHEATRSGRTWLDARDRWDELTQRDLSARARAKLVARGEYDPAKHGTGDPEPLSLSEHMEVLANGEAVARVYRHPGQVHLAVQAGASWEQIAAATGSTENRARQEYREFAEGQHRLWVDYEGKFGMGDAEYTAALARAGDEAAAPEARVPLESDGLRQVQAYLDRAEAQDPEAGQ
jgi:hypothetical protein